MFQNIVLAGATGSIGSLILRNLLESTSPAFDVTVLVRNKTNNKNPPSSSETAAQTTDNDDDNDEDASSRPPARRTYKTAVVDFHNHASLVAALRAAGPADALVSALPSDVSQAVNPLLWRAAQDARVRRFFPSEFTLDLLRPRAVAVFGADAPAVRNARELEALLDGDGGEDEDGEEDKSAVTSFTTIVPGMFLDLFLRGLAGVWDVQGGRYLDIDGGDKPFTASSTAFVAASVVAALRMEEGKTRNKRIRVAEVQTTIREVVGLIEEVKGVKLEAVALSLEEVLRRRDEAIQAQDLMGTYMNSVFYLEFDGSDVGNLADGLAFDADGDALIQRKLLRQLVEETLVDTA